jgi:hypothetical protein
MFLAIRSGRTSKMRSCWNTPAITGLLSIFFFVLSSVTVSADERDRDNRGWSGQVVVTLPSQGGIEAGYRKLERYADESGWETQIVFSGDGTPQALRLFLPSPFRSHRRYRVPRSKLPTKPQWYIYRFNDLEFSETAKIYLPFHYVEVDWNTEGLPRGPNGAFSTPHFDFHFFAHSFDYISDETRCVDNGKTCDSIGTKQEQMGRFLALPEPCFLPSNYFPDTGSSIPFMGLHNLDSDFEYAVYNVNHNPVIIYGTFDGNVVFLEASFTLFAFKDAMNRAAKGHMRTWKIAQPEAFMLEWWPTELSLKHLQEGDRFLVELHGFEQHEITDSCDP